jgi:hypothetical protein
VNVASAFAVVGINAFAFSAIFVGLVGFAISFGIALAYVGVGAVACACALFFAIALAGSNNVPEVAALLLLLFVFLPILNALADWVSLAITRSFLRGHGRGSRPALALIWVRAAADLALALVCLGALLTAIVHGLELWGRISPATLPFTAATYMAEVRADPTRGTALYLMVATTLLPTFVHLLWGLGAALSHRGHILSDAAAVLEAKLASDSPLTEIERGDLLHQVGRAHMTGYGAALVVTSLIFWLVLYPLWRLLI